MAHLGDNLKRYRLNKNWNQREMADHIGISFRSYQDIERTGKVAKSETLKTIEQKLAIKEHVSVPRGSKGFRFES